MLRRVVAFVVAAVAMVLLGSAAHSYFVQRAWSNAAGHAYGTAPVAISFADRISWAAHDLFGMFVPYCAVTTIALFIAFVIAGGLARFTGFRVLLFGLAGALAIFAAIYAHEESAGNGGHFRRPRTGRPRGANGSWRGCWRALRAAHQTSQPSFATHCLSHATQADRRNFSSRRIAALDPRVATVHISRSKLAGIAPGIDQPNHHVAPCRRKVENGRDDLACPKHRCAEQHRWMNASPAPQIPCPHGRLKRT